MENEWSFRPATSSDLPIIAEIEKRCHPSPWNQEHFEKELEKPYSSFLLITDDETDSKIAGYAIFWTVLEESQILNIVVDFPFRGLGLGQKMLRQGVRDALKKGAKRVVLEVRKSNMAAIQLYQKCHFAITNIRKNFYSDGEDAYHMSLSLVADTPIEEVI